MTSSIFQQRSIMAALLAFFAIVSLDAQSDIKPIAQKVRQLYDNNATFTPISPFTIANRPNSLALEAVKSGQFLTFHPAQIEDILYKQPDQVSIQLPYNGSVLQVDMYRENVLGNNFTVLTRQDEVQPYTPGVFYRGIIAHDFQSIVSFSFFEGEVIGFVSNPTFGNLVLGQLSGANTPNDYILYADHNLLKNNHFPCMERETGRKKFPVGTQDIPDFVNINGCVEIFFECDYALYQNKGSVSATVNYMSGMFAQVATLYNAESISIKISRIYVWTTPDAYSTASSGTALDQFMALRTSFDGDLAHLVSLSGTNLGGVAYLDVLCDPTLGYGYSGIDPTFNSVPTYSWTINVLAHELGHNFSSNHTHWCGWPGGPIDNCAPVEDGPCTAGPTPSMGGTMMSYCHLTGIGVNFSNGFGPLPRATMQAAVTTAYNGGAGCIPMICPTSSCAAPIAISVGTITQTSAIISRTAVGGASSYNMRYRPVGSSSWTSISNAVSPRTLTGLNVNSLYEVELQSVCGGSSSEFNNGVIFRTMDSPCAAPTAVTTSSPSNTGVTVSWSNSNAPAPASYDIQYGPRGFSLGSGTTVNASSSPFNLSGLVGGMAYQCYVRANCGGGNGVSAWSSTADFQTNLANDAIAGAIDLTVGSPCPGTNVFRNTSATLVGGEFSPSIANGGYWSTAADNTVWFKFTAPSSGSVKINTNISPSGSLTDTQLAIYNASSPTAASFLASNEDGLDANASFRAVMLYSGLTAGSVYYIQVDGFNAETGEFCIEVEEDFEITTPGNSCTNYPSNGTNAVNGTVNSNAGKWINLYNKPDVFNIGRPVPAIKTGQNLGNVTVSEIKNTSVPVSNGIRYMQRYYNFACTQNQAGNKSVRLFFTNTELEDLKTASGQMSSTAADLNISHYDGVNENCSPSDNGIGTSLITTVSDNSIGSSGIFFIEFTSPGFSEMGAHFGNVPLPVALISFEVAVAQKSNILQWRTASEIYFDHYDIERSSNGYSDWEKIGTMQSAKGNYTFEDNVPIENAYYRLKIIDQNGDFQYSKVLNAKRASHVSQLNKAYPNPVHDLLWIEYTLLEESDLNIQIWHSDGRLIFEMKQSVEKGTNLLPLQVKGLPSGAYHVALQSAKEILGHRQFVKL